MLDIELIGLIGTGLASDLVVGDNCASFWRGIQYLFFLNSRVVESIMPSSRDRSRSSSPYEKRAEHSYAYKDRSPRRRYSRSPSPYTKRSERSYAREDRSPRRRSSRSTSPRYRHRDRSRSPRRRSEDRPRKSGGGFRWKDKSRQYDDDDRRDDRRLERGYRDQERPRRRSPVKDNGKRDDIEAKFGKQRSPVQHESKDNDAELIFGEEPKKEKKKKDKPSAVMTSQEMIIVNVNDRLGTKASIPCLASDPISMSTPALIRFQQRAWLQADMY